MYGPNRQQKNGPLRLSWMQRLSNSYWLWQNRQPMMRSKAATTGPLDLPVRELWRRDEPDTKEGHGKW